MRREEIKKEKVRGTAYLARELRGAEHEWGKGAVARHACSDRPPVRAPADQSTETPQSFVLSDRPDEPADPKVRCNMCVVIGAGCLLSCPLETRESISECTFKMARAA